MKAAAVILILLGVVAVIYISGYLGLIGGLVALINIIKVAGPVSTAAIVWIVVKSALLMVAGLAVASTFIEIGSVFLE